MVKIYLLALLLFLVFASSVSAHQDGCHRWHSCPSDTGSYVCGDLGYDSECPYQYVALPTSTPKALPTTRKIWVTPLPTSTFTPTVTPTIDVSLRKVLAAQAEARHQNQTFLA
jgi:hypothetical protein